MIHLLAPDFKSIPLEKQTGGMEATDEESTDGTILQPSLPAVRLTTDAVPAVMASTCEWISCLDSSTLFWTQTLDAF